MKAIVRTIVTAAAITALASPALAQPAGARRGHGAQQAKQRQRAKKMIHKALTKKLGLSEARAKQVEQILQKYMSERRKLQKRARAARGKLRKLFQADSNDQKAWQAALDEMRAVHRGMYELRRKQFAELEKVLTPKQQAQLLRGLHKLQRRMHGRGGRGPRGKRGRRGRGGPMGPPDGF